MPQKIYSGLDRAKELGHATYRDFVAAMAIRSGRPWNGKISHDLKHAVTAFVDSGRWGWVCECGNPSYAEPDEPFGYCPVCGNTAIGGQARLVIFPDRLERAAIEAALLEREMDEPKGIDLGTQTVLLPACRPKREGCHRSWLPGQQAQDLKKEYERARRVR